MTENYSPAQRFKRYLRRRAIRQARKHNQWLDSVQPKMTAATWQGGSYTAFQVVGVFPILDDPLGHTVLDDPAGREIDQDP